MRDVKGTLIQTGHYIVYARGRSAHLELASGMVVDTYEDKIAVETTQLFYPENTVIVTLRRSERILITS